MEGEVTGPAPGVSSIRRPRCSTRPPRSVSVYRTTASIPRVRDEDVTCAGVESDHMGVRPGLAHRVKAAPFVLDMARHIPEASILFDVEHGHRPRPIIGHEDKPFTRVELDVSRLNPT